MRILIPNKWLTINLRLRLYNYKINIKIDIIITKCVVMINE